MSTITREFTKEQLISAANARMEFAEMMMTKDLLPLQIRNWSIEAELARIALASLEAEAVAEVCEGFTLRYIVHGPAPKSGVHIGDRLYTAPPAPANAEPVAWRYRTTDINGNPNPHWLFCEEASLLGLYQPLYAAPPAPASVPDDVSGPLAHAYKELTPTFMRNHIDVFERYGIYPDGSAGIQAMRIALDGMNRRAAMLQGAAGNYPVIPDGWVLVPKEPTEQMIMEAGPNCPDAYEYLRGAYKDMTAAAPNHSGTSDGWVACSDQNPEKGRWLTLFGKRTKENCDPYVDEGYLGSDGEFYFFDWEGGPRIDDCHPYDKAIVTHWMYWELPAAPKQEDL